MIGAIAAAWILSIGFDLLLHGGLLARLYVEPQPFLLQPAEAFRRIPLGYAAFLGLTASLYWLQRRLGISGARAGFQFGAAAGAVVWGALVLGLYSITTATVELLAGWWIGQTIELGLAGAVLGAAAAGMRRRRMWLVVSALVVVCVIVTITLQTLGYAPAVRA